MVPKLGELLISSHDQTNKPLMATSGSNVLHSDIIFSLLYHVNMKMSLVA